MKLQIMMYCRNSYTSHGKGMGCYAEGGGLKPLIQRNRLPVALEDPCCVVLHDTGELEYLGSKENRGHRISISVRNRDTNMVLEIIICKRGAVNEEEGIRSRGAGHIQIQRWKLKNGGRFQESLLTRSFDARQRLLSTRTLVQAAGLL